MSLLSVLSKRVIAVRTREEWRQLGRKVKEGEKGWQFPFVPTNAKNLHIKRVRLFSEEHLSPLKPKIESGPPAKPRCVGFTSIHDLNPREPILLPRQWRSRLIFCWPSKPTRGRPRWRPTLMDKYWYVPYDGMGNDEHDYDSVSPRRRVIYPAQGLGLGRKPKGKTERTCVCGTVFNAKRKDARYCSAACRKWGSRQPTSKPESDV